MRRCAITCYRVITKDPLKIPGTVSVLLTDGESSRVRRELVAQWQQNRALALGKIYIFFPDWF